MACILTASVTAATALTSPAHAADVNLHADDSKISRIWPMSFGPDTDDDEAEQNEADDFEARAAQRQRIGDGPSGHRHPLAAAAAAAAVHKYAGAKSSKSVDGGRKLSNHEVLR